MCWLCVVMCMCVCDGGDVCCVVFVVVMCVNERRVVCELFNFLVRICFMFVFNCLFLCCGVVCILLVVCVLVLFVVV